MILYYSGAANYEESQSSPHLSLGGYISSVAIPNDRVGATLRSISALNKSRNSKQLLMAVLKNTSGSEATNVTIYYDYPTDGQYKLELAFVSPSVDGDSNPIFEKIQSANDLPLSATFAEYNGVANEVNIGSVANDATVGIWMKATLISANIVPKTDQEIYDAFVADETDLTEEEINFSITYD